MIDKLKNLKDRFFNLPKDFILFLIAISVFSFSMSIMDSTLNNFLAATFNISPLDRGFIELPRELPGFLVVFVSAMLFFLSSRRLAVLANVLTAFGILLIAFFSKTINLMLIWLFIYSVGQHIFLPLQSSIGMELAKDGKTGKRLGQISGAGNLFAIAGSFVIFIGFKFFKFNFQVSFVMASVGFLATSIILFLMTPNEKISFKDKFRIRKEYSLYYWLCILFGTRKQIFLTFAPWVLITIFHQKVQVVATLLTIGGLIGIFFKPMLGRLIDKIGEKYILATEAFILIFVCIGYGFAGFLFNENIALIVSFICYVMDFLLMSFGMARSTYLKKIAVKSDEIAQTLTMGTTIDHIFSISIALISAIIWTKFGYQFVFLIAAVIAVINLFSALQIKIKKI